MQNGVRRGVGLGWRRVRDGGVGLRRLLDEDRDRVVVGPAAIVLDGERDEVLPRRVVGVAHHRALG